MNCLSGSRRGKEGGRYRRTSHKDRKNRLGRGGSVQDRSPIETLSTIVGYRLIGGFNGGLDILHYTVIGGFKCYVYRKPSYYL